MKNTKKNNSKNPPHHPAAEQEMFSEAKGVRPSTGGFVTAAQLAASLGFDDLDDTFLRNHARDGAPKPVKSKYPERETLLWLVKWFVEKSKKNSGLPDFASMELCETAGHIPRTMQKWAQKRGINFQKSNKGIDYEALLIGLNEKLFTPMFSGDTSKISALGIGGMAAIDGAYEEDRLTRERADEQAMLNAEKRGEILFSRDQQLAVNELQATEILFDQFLSPTKKKLLERAKRAPLTYDDLVAIFDECMKHLPPEQVEKSETANAK